MRQESHYNIFWQKFLFHKENLKTKDYSLFLIWAAQRTFELGAQARFHWTNHCEVKGRLALKLIRPYPQWWQTVNLKNIRSLSLFINSKHHVSSTPPTLRSDQSTNSQFKKSIISLYIFNALQQLINSTDRLLNNNQIVIN